MNITLRRFLDTDLPALDEWATTGDLASYMGRWMPRSAPAQVVWWMILADGKEVGAVWIEKDGPEDEVATLGILIGDPSMREKGIGREAISLAIGDATRQWQIQSIRLRVRLNNGRAIRCYASLGFHEVSRMERTSPSGETIPVMEMEKALVIQEAR